LFSTKDAESYVESMLKNFSDNQINKQGKINLKTYMDYIEFHASSLDDSAKSAFGIKKEVFRECSFNMNRCSVTDDFKWFYSRDLGNCFQSNSVKKSNFQGSIHGLSLIVGPLVNTNKKYSTIFSGKGLKLFLKDDANVPNLLDDYIWANGGKQTKISMKKVVTSNQPKPYTNCHDLNSPESVSDLLNFYTKTSRVYKQHDCLALCFQRFTIEKCKCHIVGFPVFSESRPCGNWNDFECYSKVQRNFSSNGNSFKFDCVKECPLECDSVSFETEISSIDLEPSGEFNNVSLSQSIIGTQVMNYVYLKVYFQDLKYTEISQTVKTSVIDLISNLGGALGIFLGVSVFSLFEIVEVVVQVLAVCFERGVNKKIFSTKR